MLTTILSPIALALLHGGHGTGGDSPSLMDRLQHVLSEPGHLVPALSCAALGAAVVLVRRRSARRR